MRQGEPPSSSPSTSPSMTFLVPCSLSLVPCLTSHRITARSGGFRLIPDKGGWLPPARIAEPGSVRKDAVARRAAVGARRTHEQSLQSQLSRSGCHATPAVAVESQAQHCGPPDGSVTFGRTGCGCRSGVGIVASQVSQSVFAACSHRVSTSRSTRWHRWQKPTHRAAVISTTGRCSCHAGLPPARRLRCRRLDRRASGGTGDRVDADAGDEPRTVGLGSCVLDGVRVGRVAAVHGPRRRRR